MTNARYFYWLFLINSLINIVNFVPRQLIDSRFDGAQTSILLGSVLGTFFMFLFTSLISKFPGKGIPEIYAAAMPKLVVYVLIAVFSLIWYVAGMITLLSFVDITLRFISPDTGPYLVVISFLIIVCFCARMNSTSLLYGLELILAISLPLIVYASLKAVFNNEFSWDAVFQVMTHLGHAPDLNSIVAATFSFSGYINMAIFNRSFQKLKLKHRWLIGIQGFVVLVLTFYIPIGYFGTIGVERHVYSWFSTADSIRIEAFLIERMLFIFYFAYLTLSLVSAVVHWHVGKDLLLYLLPAPKRKGSKVRLWQEWIILCVFSAVTLMLMNLDQYSLNSFGVLFLHSRLYGELLMILLLLYCYLVKRRRSS